MQEKKAGVGSMIGTIIIIAIIVIGGLYFWGKRVDDSRMNQGLNNGDTDQMANIINITAEDDLESIETDLNSTNLEFRSEI